MNYQPHEYASLFPMMDEKSFMELKRDIQENGLLDSVVLYEEKILDGRNRYKACVELGIETSFKKINGNINPLQYVISKNLKRRHLTVGQRAVLAAKVANLENGQAGNGRSSANLRSYSQAQAAEMFDVSERTVTDIKAIEKEAPDLIEEIENNKKTVNEAKKEVQKRKTKKQRTETAKKAKQAKSSELWNIYHTDMREWKSKTKYDFIITDPPYPKEYLTLYENLAKNSRDWLKDGGLLIVMCGQSYLDEIFNLLKQSTLQYYWTAAYLTPGQPTPLRQRQVNTTWKPLLMFSKGEYKGKIFGDVFKSDANDKDFHKWGQSVSGMYSIVSGICLPGQRILDPFCGAGTTGIAALMHNCFFDGIELDAENANISKARLHDSTEERRQIN